jgi:hypothetical protein
MSSGGGRSCGQGHGAAGWSLCVWFKAQLVGAPTVGPRRARHATVRSLP